MVSWFGLLDHFDAAGGSFVAEDVLSHREEMEQTLRDLLVALRNQRGLTQQDVAERLDASQVYVSNIETGRRTLDAIEFAAIARVYGEHPGDLLRSVWDAVRSGTGVADRDEDTSFSLEGGVFSDRLEEIHRHVIQYLRRIRNTRQLGQSEVAQMMGWSQSILSHIEQGKRTLKAHELLALCELYDLDLESVGNEIRRRLESETFSPDVENCRERHEDPLR